MNSYTIYTRSLVDEYRTGKWSAVIVGEHFYKELHGQAPQQYNKNRMELVSVANALSIIKEESEIFVMSDSQFVSNAFTRGWVVNWKNKDWIRGQGQKAFNTDVLEYILSATKKHSISFRWLQDYSSCNESKRAEELLH